MLNDRFIIINFLSLFVLLLPRDLLHCLTAMGEFHFFQYPVFYILINSFFAAKFMVLRTLFGLVPIILFLNVLEATGTKYSLALVALEGIYRNVFAQVALDLGHDW